MTIEDSMIAEVTDHEVQQTTTPLIVGLVGGVGSGKSTVARWVNERIPSLLLDADRVGHQILQEPKVIQHLTNYFGPDILDAEGRIARAKLALRVFGCHPEQQQARTQLEKIVHPEIRRELQRLIQSAVAQSIPVILLDAAVLLEAGWRDLCQRVVFIDAPAELRLQRATSRPGWTQETWYERESAQWPLERKRQLADAVITNLGTIDDAGQQLLSWLRSWLHDSSQTIMKSPPPSSPLDTAG